MKVFISYSGADTNLVAQIASELKMFVEPLYWQKDKLPGAEDWAQIFNWINESSIVLVVLSKSVVERGLAVGQEIGFAKKSGKIIIPFASKDIVISDYGFLKGLTAIHFDETDHGKALSELRSAISEHKRIEGAQSALILSAGLVLLYVLSRDG